MKKVILYTDGGARGNPGPAGAGMVITDEVGATLKEASKPLGTATNNEAEYEAAILGFQSLKDLFQPSELAEVDVEHKLDSELVCKQLRGEYRIKEPRLKALYNDLKELIASLGTHVIFTHIPRAQNTAADTLANKAMDEIVNRGS